MYLAKSNIAMIWPYDERGRMIGEDVWEYHEVGKGLIKLPPEDVLTAEEAGKPLEPLINPLPPLPASCSIATKRSARAGLQVAARLRFCNDRPATLTPDCCRRSDALA
jgi:hypothetical protein